VQGADLRALRLNSWALSLSPDTSLFGSVASWRWWHRYMRIAKQRARFDGSVGAACAGLRDQSRRDGGKVH